jgi:hypothetical protein
MCRCTNKTVKEKKYVEPDNYTSADETAGHDLGWSDASDASSGDV